MKTFQFRSARIIYFRSQKKKTTETLNQHQMNRWTSYAILNMNRKQYDLRIIIVNFFVLFSFVLWLEILCAYSFCFVCFQPIPTHFLHHSAKLSAFYTNHLNTSACWHVYHLFPIFFFLFFVHLLTRSLFPFLSLRFIVHILISFVTHMSDVPHVLATNKANRTNNNNNDAAAGELFSINVHILYAMHKNCEIVWIVVLVVCQQWSKEIARTVSVPLNGQSPIDFIHFLLCFGFCCLFFKQLSIWDGFRLVAMPFSCLWLFYNNFGFNFEYSCIQ